MSVALCWMYACGLILLKESYRLRHTPQFSLVAPLFDSNYSGMYSWHLACNFLLLRILSFQLDLLRGEADPDSYSLLNYLTYIVYWPLYMAGPIITYDDFIACTKREVLEAAPPEKWRQDAVYALRWLLSLGAMELLAVHCPVFAIQRSGLLYALSPTQLAAQLYLTLKVMWLKFLLMWRFFTLAARLDRVDAPENMLRCVSNNHSLAGFWRGWHASFNKWILRYMYLPLEGRKNGMATVWIVFVFVALWHDLDLKLLLWGLLNALFWGLELRGRALATSEAFQRLPAVVSSSLTTAAGGLYILVLIGVNMIGYAFGVDGFLHSTRKLLGTGEGLRVLAASFYFLCIGVCVMKLIEDCRRRQSSGAPEKMKTQSAEEQKER